ncbi:eukaryotic translation initiation factor 2A [Arachis duranensis]|uniref:Eukaryotic translation initiation factor 2A n=1 Tax=Arachis duranensis TaxID=130453 RepID=A0A6P4BWP7_ARADU|nr:eukaryotic translation initiation factor 2A [Arachis duranensis]XP_015944461.1 eukaryotic translation initiation factor 2A [Arachis duranensis]
MASTDQSPTLEILVRTPEELSIWTGPPFANGQPGVKLEKVSCVNAKFSDDGSRLMVTKSNSVISIYDCKSAKEIRSFEVPNVTSAILSPCGTFLQTFQKPSAPQEKNVTLWKTENGDPVYQHSQKNLTKTTWPAIQFSSNEATACRMATNEVQFFDTRDFSKGIIDRLRVPGVSAIELSSAPGSHVAAYVPESKGIPACVQIFPCGNASQSQAVARRSFFRCSTTQLKWNHGSTGLLVLVQSDVDKTNQSYYGESKLFYLTIDGKHEGLVPLSKEGPVHDAQWSYSGLEFAVVYGFMPAKATLFDKKCNPLLELGTGPYNTIRWNPKGKFLCLAGFGNLPGDMVFWDYADKKQLAATKAEWSVTSEWSPDGRYFMTATTAPRLQVDNGIKIFHYNGSLYFTKMFDKLFQADWKPEPADKFGDITELIKSLNLGKVEDKKPSGPGPKSAEASNKLSSTNPPAQKPAAYRPPHAKNAAAVQAELLGIGESSPAGSMSKNALRNKKKREKQKEKKAASDANS